MLYEKAPAKINLSLDILGKRADGFHEVEMVMTTIDLADRLAFTKLPVNKIVIETSSQIVPTDSKNLAYQAAALLRQKFGITDGVKISIEKKIPVAAGLAGGSADAAATLRGLNRLFHLGLSLEELAQLGASLGSDIPFCVYGGTALATGRGEIIQEIPNPPNCWVVLAKPHLPVSTATVYKHVKLNRLVHPPTAQMLEGIQQENLDIIFSSLGNVLEASTFELYPEVKRLKEKVIQFGSAATLMSGSGPTVFTLLKNEKKAIRIYNSLRGFCPEVYCVRMGSH